MDKYSSVMAQQPVGSMRAGMVQASLARVLAICAALAFLASGCSPEIAFPAIHDMPPPRADTPLTPEQVKQATDDLISERNHLSTETQAAAAAADAAPTANVAAAAPAKKKKAKAPAKPPAQATVQASAVAPEIADGAKP